MASTDPGNVLVSATSLAKSLDGASGASKNLEKLATSVHAVEARTQRIQEWNHFTDPSSKMQMMQSLLDAMITVNHAMQRLQGDLSNIHATATAQRSEHSDTSPAIDESHVKVHSVDIGECASLLQFTLIVCQLPLGHDTQVEIEELGAGARMLRQAQISSRLERRRLVHRPMAEDKLHSDDYQTFLDQVLEAERDLPREKLAPQPTAQMETRSGGTSKSPPVLTLDTTTQSSKQADPEVARHNDNASRQDDSVGIAVSTPLDEAVSAPAFSPTSTIGESYTSSPSSLARAPPTYTSDNRESPSDAKQAGPASRSPAPFATPPLPSKSPARQQDVVNSIGLATHPPTKSVITRKPLSHSPVENPIASSSRPQLSNQAQPYQPSDRSSSTSPQDSAYSLMEKVNPITQSLSSLHEGEYLSVELERPPAQPYADQPPTYSRPPLYTQVSDAVEALSQLELTESETLRSASLQRSTTQSTMVDPKCPLVITLSREDRTSDLLEILKQGFNVNEADSRTGKTAIMEAAQYRRFDTCRILLKAGARLHLKDNNGETALHYAARNGDADICKMLLNAGALSEDCNKKGELPLELAAAGGHNQAVLCLIDRVQSRHLNDTAMVKAFLETVKLGDMTMAQMFLARNVKPRKFKDSWKPVAYAAQSGSLPMLDLMLREKCNLKDKSPDGWTALHFAAKHGQQSMAEKLLSLKLNPKAATKQLEETPLHLATASGHTSTALAILHYKDSTAIVKDKDDIQPIHHVARHGDLKLTTALLDKGASLTTATKYGWKPIHLAAANGHVPLLAEILTRGLSIEDKLQPPSFRPEKRTNAAARRGYSSEIRWPHTGARALHLALEFGHDDAAQMLISSGCKLDESDSRGWRPLHYAAFHCRPEILHVLLSKGVAVDSKTVDGFTASALGVREFGLPANRDQEQRVRKVQEMLRDAEMAMQQKKGGKLRSTLADMRWVGGGSGSGNSKTAAQRNLAWYAAGMAEAVCVGVGDGGEGEDDENLSNRSVSTDGVGGSMVSLGEVRGRGRGQSVSVSVYGDGVPGASGVGK